VLDSYERPVSAESPVEGRSAFPKASNPDFDGSSISPGSADIDVRDPTGGSGAGDRPERFRDVPSSVLENPAVRAAMEQGIKVTPRSAPRVGGVPEAGR